MLGRSWMERCWAGNWGGSGSERFRPGAGVSLGLLERLCKGAGEPLLGVGQVLDGRCWRGDCRAGEVPERFRRGSGEVPERFWRGSGEVLERFWRGSGKAGKGFKKVLESMAPTTHLLRCSIFPLRLQLPSPCEGKVLPSKPSAKGLDGPSSGSLGFCFLSTVFWH